MDDILVTVKSTEEHLQNLESVLSKLESAGLRLNRTKCFFYAIIDRVFGPMLLLQMDYTKLIEMLEQSRKFPDPRILLS